MIYRKRFREKVMVSALKASYFNFYAIGGSEF